MSDEEFMTLAIAEADNAAAENEIPVGAVAVLNDIVIAAEHNRMEQLHDATAHAEILLIRKISSIINDWRLSDVTIYVTKEPCVMCGGAMVNAHLHKVVYGLRDPRSGADTLGLLRNPDLLYQEVLDGKFTLDRMNTLVAGAYADLNNDGITDLDDRLGMLTHALAAAVDPFVYGSDIVFTTRDEEGFIQLQMMSEDAVALAEKLCAFFHQRAVSPKSEGKHADIFKKGNVLFMGNCRLMDSTVLRDMEDDFGYLPFPKYDDEQEEYHSLVHDTALQGCISIASQNLDIAGAVLEALNAESYRIVTPAWYESALKLKYARDDVASQMIDLIKDSMTTNFIFAYSFSLNNLGLIYRNLVGGNNPNYASYVQSILPAAEQKLADLVKVFKGE